MKLNSFFVASMIFSCFIATATEYRPVKIKASSEYKIGNRHLARYAGDGKVKSARYWLSSFKNKAQYPHWLEFDFGKPIKFDCIKLYMDSRKPTILEEYSLQCRTGDNWKTIVSQKYDVREYFRQISQDSKNKYSVKAPDPYPEFRFPPIVSDKVRLLVNRVPDGNARVYEMTVSFVGKNKKTSSPSLNGIPTSFRCFDFGPAGLKTFAEFYRVSQHSKYNPAKGYGWLTKQKLQSCERTTCEYQLKKDFLVSEKYDSTFRIKLKSGDYCMAVFTGDALLNSPALYFSNNGNNFVMPKNFPGQFYWNIYSIKSINDVIDLKFKAPWLINAIIVAPMEKLNELNDLIAKIQLHPGCNSADSQFTHSPDKTWTRKPQISAKDQKNGFICYLPSPQQRIFPKTTPRENQRDSVLRVAAAKGEFKAANLAVYALKTISSLNVTVGQLKDEKGTVLPTDCVELRVVRCWPQRGGSKGSSKIWLTVPELLEKYTPQIVPANTSRQFWLTLSAPANATASIYSGSIKLQADGGPEKIIPLQFKIYPFTLQCPPEKVFAIYQNNNLVPNFANQDSSWEFDLKKLKDMRRHGMNSVVLNIPPKQTLTEVLKTVKRCNELLDEAGFPKQPIPYYRYNSAYKPEIIVKIQAAIKANGWRELLYYPIDEPFKGAKLKKAVKAYRDIKSVKGVRTYCTVYQNSVDKLGNSLDVCCYAVSGQAKFDAERIRRDCRKNNQTFWWYSNGAREYPAVARFKAGFFFWKTGSDGQLYWAYMDNRGDAFNDFDTYSSDHCAVYLVNQEPTPTIQWECIREGINDFKYIYTLEQAIKRAPKSKAKECAKARQLLAKIRKETLVDLNEYRKRFGSDLVLHIRSAWAPEKYDRYRKEIAEQIIRLNK